MTGVELFAWLGAGVLLGCLHFGLGQAPHFQVAPACERSPWSVTFVWLGVFWNLGQHGQEVFAASLDGFGAQVLKCHGGGKRYEAWLLEKRFVQFWTLLVKGGCDPVVFFKAG